TDDSSHSQLALERAAQFAAGNAAEVTVLTVSYLVNLASFGGLGYAPEATYEVPSTEDAKAILAKAAAFMKEKGVEPRTVHRIGAPSDMILDEAEKLKADLIIVGSHGRTGLQRFLLGSVSSAIVSHAACSVLVVKAPSYQGERTEGAQAATADRA
ncbi:MAG TPA: universal stress protein, partial [Pantanalinema sp.]